MERSTDGRGSREQLVVQRRLQEREEHLVRVIYTVVSAKQWHDLKLENALTGSKFEHRRRLRLQQKLFDVAEHRAVEREPHRKYRFIIKEAQHDPSKAEEKEHPTLCGGGRLLVHFVSNNGSIAKLKNASAQYQHGAVLHQR
jgi:hypothetical protein